MSILRNMGSKVDQFLQDKSFLWEGHSFELSSQMISLLHHWNFGTTKEYYRSRNKSLVAPDITGTLRKIQDVEGALNAAFEAYNQIANNDFSK